LAAAATGLRPGRAAAAGHIDTIVDYPLPVG